MQFASATLSSLTTLLSLYPLFSTAAVLPRDASGSSSPLQKRDNGASCNFEYQDAGWMAIQVTTWGYWADDWGNTFLQNLYNQCGTVNGWGFWYDDGNNAENGHATFTIKEYTPACVQNAIWWASEASGAIWGVSCQDNTWTDPNK